MEVSMETNASLSPLPQQPFPTSPNTPRKRSFHEVDASASTSETKNSAVPSSETNQENTAPANYGPSVNGPADVANDKPGAVVGSLTHSNILPTIEIDAKQDILQPSTPSGSALSAIPTPNTNVDNAPSTPAPAASTTNPAAKKRKLSPASKEAKQQEKEAKERQRIEEKAKKEEEKRVKEEEKKKRDAEREEERKRREEKKKLKEEEKAAKEGEKRKKEEEKMRKERSQMRLNAFFAKPPATSSAPSSNTTSSTSPRKPSAGDGAGSEDSSNDSATVVTDYQRAFPDFFLQSHTTLAPMHRFQRDADALDHIRAKVDASLKKSNANDEQEAPIFRPSELFNMIPYRRRFGKRVASVKQILLEMQTLDESVGLHGASGTKAVARPHELLKKVTMKSLKFSEDVRPPYQGTFTRPLSESSAVKLSRNPYYRGLPDTNYDYDSEAEWEEPEEGEDLDSEEEEEGSEDGDDDMEGFLDDEDDGLVDGKRRLIVGDLEPNCSGICWQENGVPGELEAYKIETILDSVSGPIDPFSTSYWQKPKPVDQAPVKSSQPIPSGRSTLHAYAVNSSAHLSQAASAPKLADRAALTLQTVGKAKRPFPPEQLSEFRQVVEGSDLTKMGLIEILKKRFPKVSKDVLKDTLNSVAVRVGQKEADKKWVCK